MPVILFRPSFLPMDETVWIPALRKVFAGMDFRVAPDSGDAADVNYIIGWKLEEGDRYRWPNLKAILTLGAGANQYIGHPEMPENVKLIRMIEPGLDRGMAEFIASMVLRFHKEHDFLTRDMAAGQWHTGIPKLAPERTVGFMGLGRMAQACIDMLEPFGFRLSGWSRSRKPVEGVTGFAGPEELKPFLEAAEILVCLLPLTAGTKDILNRETLSLLPRGAFVINAARGKHMVDEDLLALLESGHLGGAALDVFRREPPPPDHPFRHHPKIIATPHIAAITMPDSGGAALLQAVQQLERGEDPPGLVNPDREY